jgi:hypothetical protein
MTACAAALLALLAPLPFPPPEPVVPPGRHAWADGSTATLRADGTGEYRTRCGFLWRVVRWSVVYDREERRWFVGMSVIDPRDGQPGFAQFRPAGRRK